MGFIRPKHVRWLRPLLETGHVRCFVLQVTDSGHRFKGCNVVLTGIGRALEALEELPQPRRAGAGVRLPCRCLNPHRAGPLPDGHTRRRVGHHP
ncbi:MAG: hypothetical protein KatS3mg043_2184 [Rhodothermaceae bacterium]|nr:MAG: hypothetical protein KatS3mg043_2184 [Rhodothermaceae bacterium]